jgi:hypothetical protein
VKLFTSPIVRVWTAAFRVVKCIEHADEYGHLLTVPLPSFIEPGLGRLTPMRREFHSSDHDFHLVSSLKAHALAKRFPWRLDYPRG